MIFISSDGEFVNTDSNNPYFKKINKILDFWYSDEKSFSIFTSGSTGQPSEIKISRKQIIISINQTKNIFNLTSENLFFCCLSLDSIGGIMMIFRALYLKAEAIVSEPSSDPFKNSGKVKFILEKKRWEVFYAFVPIQITNLIENPENHLILKAAKGIIIGGAKINQTLNKKIASILSNAFESYGMTETVSHVALRQIKSGTTYFKPLKNIEIRQNIDNCLEIKGEITLGKWLVTNDIVKIHRNSNFEILGRKDNIINSGGVKLQLEHLDLKIAQLFKSKQRYFFYGIVDEKLGQKLVLFIENKDSIITKEDFKGILSKFEVPKEIIFLERFIDTASGKIDKIKTINEFFTN